jgi:hypothetical protein
MPSFRTTQFFHVPSHSAVAAQAFVIGLHRLPPAHGMLLHMQSWFSERVPPLSSHADSNELFSDPHALRLNTRTTDKKSELKDFIEIPLLLRINNKDF